MKYLQLLLIINQGCQILGIPEGIHFTRFLQGEFPYYAFLQSYNPFSTCGGIVITRIRILTAAHCLEKKDGRLKYSVEVRTLYIDLILLYVESIHNFSKCMQVVSHFFQSR